VAPPSRQDEVADLRRRSAAASDEPALAIARAALPAAAATEIAQRALLPERFYRDAFARDAARQARAAALYLPAVDIAADGWRGGEVAFAELVAAELQAADRLLGELVAGGEWGTVLVVIDPARRGGGEGRALLWRRGGCAAGAGGADVAEAVRPEALAAGLFRAAGLPQSAELPAPPELCRWPAPPASVSSYGRRDAEAAAASSDEYLRNLRSLGYV